MSSLINFGDDEDDLFGNASVQSQQNKPSKNLDDIFGASTDKKPSANTLDDIFTTPTTDDDLFNVKVNKKDKTDVQQTDNLFGTGVDEEEDIFGFGIKTSEPPKERTSSSLDDIFDSWMDSPSTQSKPQEKSPGLDDLLQSNNSNQSESKEITQQSHDLDSLLFLNTSQSEPPRETESQGISHDPSNDSLDFLLEAQPLGTVPSSDDLLSLVDRATSEVPVTHVKTKTTKMDKSKDSNVNESVDDTLDDFFGSGTDNKADIVEDSPEPEETDDIQYADDEEGDVEDPTTEQVPDFPEVKETVSEAVQDFKDNSGKESDEDTQPQAVRLTEKETAETKSNLSKSKYKKKMERSFDDLLNGLSDESEPELDDMLMSDDNDNTNLERWRSPDKFKQTHTSTSHSTSHRRPMMAPSLLVTPDKPPTSNAFVTPSRDLEPSVHMDVYQSTPNDQHLEYSDNDDSAESDVKVTAPEVKVHTPDDEPWDNDNQNTNAGHDDVVMRTRGRTDSQRSKTSTDDGEIDLSAIEDTNHLDVDLNKHKSALGKKGSMALRRKPSRKSRKSLMSTGDDAIFQDSTEPKPVSMTNGADDNDGDADNYDMSPPAKKPSPAMMIPLPGMSTKPPTQRLSASSPDDDDTSRDSRRVSKPPPGAFKLPAVVPRLKPTTSDNKPSPRPRNESISPVFDKPALKSVQPPTSKPMEKERDMTFEKPALKSTPKPSRDRTPDDDMDTNTGMFNKPSLRSTPKPKPSERDHKPEDSLDTGIYDTKQFRNTPKREIAGTSRSEPQHVFDKPALRSTGRKLTDSIKTDNQSDTTSSQDSVKTFEKPLLRTASINKETSDSTSDINTNAHKFDKPALRSTPSRNARNVTDKGDNTNVEFTGTFEKPSLKRATPSPEKEIKLTGEVKGTFDKPSLKKMDNSRFTEQKAKTAEKPSWLQTAASKQAKALTALQAKENHNGSPDKPVPSWLEKTPLRKTATTTPLQDNSNNQSETHSNEDIVKQSRDRTRSRGSSTSSDKDTNTKNSSETTKHNNFSPSWMKQGRSPSTPNVTGMTSLTPAISCPTLDSEEVPQWKKDLAQRRQSRKESSPMGTPRKEDSAEPEWKKNVALRKLRPTATPSKETQSVEPEWKKAAEEKRARLRKSATPGHLTSDP